MVIPDKIEEWPGEEPPPNIVINVRKYGEVVEINNAGVKWSALDGKLREIYSLRAEKSVFVTGENKVPYQYIVQAIDTAVGAGVERVSLMTYPRDGGLCRRMPPQAPSEQSK